MSALTLHRRSASEVGSDPAWLSASKSLYSTPGWLASVETFGGKPCEVLEVRRDGKFVCALPTYHDPENPNEFYRPRVQLGDIESSSAPARLLGTRSGYETCLVGDADQEAISLLRATVLADGPATAMYVPESELATPGSADLYDGIAIPLNAAATLTAPGDTFDDYLASLSRGRRSSVRREQRAFAAAGHRLSRERLSGCYEEAGRLLAATQRKYGHPTTDEIAIRLLLNQSDHLDHESDVHTIRTSSQEMVGFCLTYIVGGWTWVRAVGVATDRSLDAFEYFNLAIYEPLVATYERGGRGLRLGIESFAAKSLRGAHLDPLWLLPVGWTPGTTEQRSRHTSRFLDHVTSQLPDELSATRFTETVRRRAAASS